ncbi:MAG TPA: hypothetical protein VFK57_17590 [Vicinamibacterales bacterium]|nr:hypothetical protein [Vicinamibacterales bacterium]
MRLAFLLLPLLGIGAAGAPPPPASPELARKLMSVMAERGLQTMAARDPAASDRFVAAMAFPGVQLLVVAGRHTSPMLVESQLAHKQFAEVYAELQSAAVADGKLFFQDMGGDGLEGNTEAVDVMYEQGSKQTLFDGDWKRMKLSKEAYEKRLSEADQRYTELLKILVSSVSKTD